MAYFENYFKFKFHEPVQLIVILCYLPVQEKEFILKVKYPYNDVIKRKSAALSK